MNKRIYLPSAIVLIAILLSGCAFQMVAGSGKVVSETRNVGDFSQITLAGIGDVYVTQGATTSVRIEAEDNLIQYFDTSVKGSTLTIGLKDQYMGISLQPTRPIKFYVTSPKVDAITLAGSGNFLAGDIQSTAFSASLLGSGDITTGSIQASSVDIHLAGSGNVQLGAVTSDTLTANLAGSGNIQLASLKATSLNGTIAGSGNFGLSGEVSDQHIEILGSGDYLAGGLNSQTATIRQTGSGSSQLAVSETLDVTILGSGDVVYSGTPKVNTTIAGSGKVRQSGD
ncbi:MAG TPA: head GIN domain-containing protein [Anaerolineales bacterium]|nr:head GIN domain-containing protein [Anaerolineales bacterium]